MPHLSALLVALGIEPEEPPALSDLPGLADGRVIQTSVCFEGGVEIAGLALVVL